MNIKLRGDPSVEVKNERLWANSVKKKSGQPFLLSLWGEILADVNGRNVRRWYLLLL